KILLAGEEPQKWPALLRYMVANRTAQHRINRFQRVDHGALRGRTLDVELHLAGHVRQPAQVCWEHDPDHGSVCTSTESTAGRPSSRAAYLSPASAEQYTLPPVVPK